MIKYVQNDRPSRFRVTRSLVQVLLTQKSQFQCPKSDRIHSAARHLLGSFISKQTPPPRNSSSVYPRLLFPLKLVRYACERTRVLLRGVSAPHDASLTNIQRCLHASTHGSADSAPGKPASNYRAFPQSSFIQTEASLQTAHAVCVG